MEYGFLYIFLAGFGYGKRYGAFTADKMFLYSVGLAIVLSLLTALLMAIIHLFRNTTFRKYIFVTLSILYFMFAPAVIDSLEQVMTADHNAYEIASIPDRGLNHCFEGTSTYDEWVCYNKKVDGYENCSSGNNQTECLIIDAVDTNDISYCQNISDSLVNKPDSAPLKHTCVGLALDIPFAWTKETLRSFNAVDDLYKGSYGLRKDYFSFQSALIQGDKAYCKNIITPWYRDFCLNQ